MSTDKGATRACAHLSDGAGPGKDLAVEQDLAAVDHGSRVVRRRVARLDLGCGDGRHSWRSAAAAGGVGVSGFGGVPPPTIPVNVVRSGADGLLKDISLWIPQVTCDTGVFVRDSRTHWGVRGQRKPGRCLRRCGAHLLIRPTIPFPLRDRRSAGDVRGWSACLPTSAPP